MSHALIRPRIQRVKVAGNLLHVSSYRALNIIRTECWSIVGWKTVKTLPFCLVLFRLRHVYVEKIPGSPRDTYSHSERAWERGYAFCCLPSYFPNYVFYVPNPCVLGTRPVLPCRNGYCYKLVVVNGLKYCVTWLVGIHTLVGIWISIDGELVHHQECAVMHGSV